MSNCPELDELEFLEFENKCNNDAEELEFLRLEAELQREIESEEDYGDESDDYGYVELIDNEGVDSSRVRLTNSQAMLAQTLEDNDYDFSSDNDSTLDDTVMRPTSLSARCRAQMLERIDEAEQNDDLLDTLYEDDDELLEDEPQEVGEQTEEELEESQTRTIQRRKAKNYKDVRKTKSSTIRKIAIENRENAPTKPNRGIPSLSNRINWKELSKKTFTPRPRTVRDIAEMLKARQNRSRSLPSDEFVAPMNSRRAISNRRPSAPVLGANTTRSRLSAVKPVITRRVSAPSLPSNPISTTAANIPKLPGKKKEWLRKTLIKRNTVADMERPGPSRAYREPTIVEAPMPAPVKRKKSVISKETLEKLKEAQEKAIKRIAGGRAAVQKAQEPTPRRRIRRPVRPVEQQVTAIPANEGGVIEQRVNPEKTRKTQDAAIERMRAARAARATAETATQQPTPRRRRRRPVRPSEQEVAAITATEGGVIEQRVNPQNTRNTQDAAIERMRSARAARAAAERATQEPTPRRRTRRPVRPSDQEVAAIVANEGAVIEQRVNPQNTRNTQDAAIERMRSARAARAAAERATQEPTPRRRTRRPVRPSEQEGAAIAANEGGAIERRVDPERTRRTQEAAVERMRAARAAVQRAVPQPITPRAPRPVDHLTHVMTDNGDGVLLHGGVCECPEDDTGHSVNNCFSVRRYNGSVNVTTPFTPACCHHRRCENADKGYSMVSSAVAQVEKFQKRLLRREIKNDEMNDDIGNLSDVIYQIVDCVKLLKTTPGSDLEATMDTFLANIS